METPEPRSILVVDDEDAMRHMLRMVLEEQGYQVEEAAGGEQALERLGERSFDVVLCDIRMPGMDGRSFLRRAIDREIAATVIMMSAFGTVDTAVACLKEGAYDYVSKPFKPDEVVLALRKAEERERLRRENRLLRRELDRSRAAAGGREPVFVSSAMGRVMALVDQAVSAASPVLITGETGTGKELVARALHERGPRREAPFVAVNCAALPAELLESELFGHVRGAFTGADRERPGLFGAADGGLLFLDEIAELPLELQPKLLRVLQEGEVRPVGEARSRRVDVRVATATARDLREEVAAGRFRDDLYYRLAVVEIEVPPLRERPEDISLLAAHFARRIAEREGRPAPVFEADALQTMTDYAWPGNVRELENFVERALIFCRKERIGPTDLPWEVRRRERGSAGDLSLKKASRRLESEYIRRALVATGGNRTHAARLLEISLRSLLYKIKEFGLERQG